MPSIGKSVEKGKRLAVSKSGMGRRLGNEKSLLMDIESLFEVMELFCA
jgi:hypothetical protein